MQTAQELVMVISELANKKGVSVNKALKESGVGEGLPAHLRRGSIPSADRVVMLAEYFGVSTDYLLGRTTVTKPYGDVINEINTKEGDTEEDEILK